MAPTRDLKEAHWLLKLALLEGNKKGCAKILSEIDGG